MNQSETTTQPTIPPPGKKPRRPLPRWTLGVVFVVVFAAGCIVGGMVATKVIHSKMEAYRRHAPIFAEDIVARLRMRLGLTDDQAEQVKEIFIRRHGRMIEYRGQGAQAMHTEFDAMEKEIAAVLDEQQKYKWQAIADSVRRRFLPPTANSGARNSEAFEDTFPDSGRPLGGQAGKTSLNLSSAVFVFSTAEFAPMIQPRGSTHDCQQRGSRHLRNPQEPVSLDVDYPGSRDRSVGAEGTGCVWF